MTPAVRLAPAVRDLARPYRRRLGLVAAGVLVAALLDLVGPLAIRHLVDDNLAPRRTAGLAAVAVVYLAALAAGQFVTAGYGYLAATVAQRALAGLRVRLFTHLLALPTTYHDQTPTGDAVARATSDVDTIDDLFSSSAATLLGETVRLVAVIAAMLALSPTLTGVAALALPPLVVLSTYLRRRIRDAERSTRRAVGDVTALLQEILAGVDVIRAHARQPEIAERVRRALCRWLAAVNASTRYNSVYAPGLAILSATATAALVWLGGHGVAHRAGVSIGTLTAFILLFARFFTPLINLGDEWQSVQAALAGAERVFAILAIPADDRPVRRAPRSPRPAPVVELRGVSFGYQPRRPVLRDISLAVRAGEHVALVGRSGAGKSSILALLAGLYPARHGAVVLAGRDPASLSDAERRLLLGYVPQTAQLFTGTIHDNLTYADTTIGAADVVRAARITGAHSLISALPDGYRTMVGAGGVALSAGQRQLLALTRALVTRPRVLLLDEATAVIDAASDAAIRAGLRDHVQPAGTAIVSIAHRLATARAADRVVVIASGRIVEQGTAPQLAASGGAFAAFDAIDRAGWDWSGDG